MNYIEIVLDSVGLVILIIAVLFSVKVAIEYWWSLFFQKSKLNSQHRVEIKLESNNSTHYDECVSLPREDTQNNSSNIISLPNLEEVSDLEHKTVRPVLNAEQAPAFNLDSMKGAVLHTRQRYKERYGYRLSDSMYISWLEQIREGKAILVELRDDDSMIYCVVDSVFNKDVYVVYNHDVIVTAILPRGEYITTVNNSRAMYSRGEKRELRKI